MSAENFLNAETDTFGGIIKGDNKFKVPLYQRDYSWNKTHWNDLWLDIETNRKNDSKHYMGSVVLVSKHKKQYDIIDGQQRLTTLTILVLAVVDTLNDLVKREIDVENNEKRIELLITDFIGKKSLSSLNYENKIELNESNNPFFSTYLTNFRKPVNIKSTIKSNKLLFDCFNYYKELIKEEIFMDEDVSSLISFVEYISDSLLFIQITATDDLSAYLIFETLNDRGLDLSVTDLLKNYLFSIVDETDKSHVKNIWDVTINHVSYSGFPKFLRHYWMMQNGLIQEKELFKTVKRHINTPSTAFDLLNSMSEVSEVYAALSDSTHQLWEGEEKVKRHIRELSLFNVTQCYPLLINAYLYLEHDDWIATLRICSVISFRYMVVSGLNPNALESKYNEACKAMNAGAAKTARDIFLILQPLYVSDEDFERNFESKSIRTKRSAKLARYIVYSIENHLSEHSFDFEYDNGSLEHVLPENPSSEWNENFPKDIEESFIYRLGNFTLLEPDKNRVIGNKNFEHKSEVYKTSRYELTKRFGFQKWNQENLKARQKYLAKQAKAIWHLPYA
ncbi:DUF262 domain-containing HNH endonuclease family protein [Colwellia sp. 1_MG-2023]|uniref:DUF262 domain-containing protein n=1 Tax=unclassified Colwellia TaxID=196834 RepID=UPI001C099BB5|nr:MULTISPECIES: DUF262 domain-containing protein [unclassified Colwellia]MBU2924416.1 DUF262 domain-containing HNH endonuclease family protein [Colwellia sp. C2M11]MDO6650782.1 DUF262 domain-containing HNH endonuclease family protein [Colwellia sp. 3_MG-2023]MDO6663817.1 DUF262 domain-containing HNH endonuclease family protein [Colwellia sp. 2_MG-2023]MDO6688168.1 DUF262 domain-containing HNH endonuclease family protein [Colwellia sp. 1_MG-2023]